MGPFNSLYFKDKFNLPSTLLANPKSQIFTVQSSFISTLAGFKSLKMLNKYCFTCVKLQQNVNILIRLKCYM